MKKLSILLLVVMVSLSAYAMNEEKEMAEINGTPSFQPKPLDDEWSKWLVGEWKGIVGLHGIKSEASRKIELGLNGQFLITKHEHQVASEEIQELKKMMHISDEDIQRYQSSPFKYLEIWTIDPKNGEVVGYLFDSLRRVAEGKGKLQGNKETVEWQWFAQGQRAFSSIRIIEKVSDDRFIATTKYIPPDGSTMEGIVEMTRKKRKADK